MTDMIYYLNGEFIPSQSAALPLNDLGIVRGYGVFDLLRTYAGAPFKLAEHVARLQRSAGAIGIDLPWSAQDLVDIALETYRCNDLPDATIRIVVTGGVSPNFMTPPEQPTLAVLIEPVVNYAPADYEEGAKLVTVEMARFLPTVKSLNYIAAIMAMKKASQVGAVEALYRNGDGLVSECTRSNLFAIRGGQLITPNKDVLFGITRAVVIEIAGDSLEIVEGELHYDVLLTCDEVFITSSTKEVLPVVEIDGRVIGTGKPGSQTRRLGELFHTYVQNGQVG